MHATRAHLLELVGDRAGAASDYRQAAALTASLPERRYLIGRANALGSPATGQGVTGGPSSTLGTYSTSWIGPSKVRLFTMSRATSGYPS